MNICSISESMTNMPQCLLFFGISSAVILTLNQIILCLESMGTFKRLIFIEVQL